MAQAFLRNTSAIATKFLLSSTKSTAFNLVPKQTSLFSITASTRFQLRLYSSQDEDDDVSYEELKRRVKRFYDGDQEAIPSIFEGILKRKLTGKHEESDDELMKELPKLYDEAQGPNEANGEEMDSHSSDDECDSDTDLED